MAAVEYHFGQRGYPGFTISTTLSSGSVARQVVPAMALVDSGGNALPAGSSADPTYTQSGLLPAGTDRSGSATTSSAQIAAANASRRGLHIQNIGANNIGINEFGGTAAIGTAGTFTLAPGLFMTLRTNRAITAIAATGTTAFTATEW